MAKLTAGIDLGGTKIQVVVLRARKVAGQARIPTPHSGVDDVATAMAETVRDALAEGGLAASDLAAVGVGSPGEIGQEKGTVARSPNVPGFEGADPVPLAGTLSRKLRRVPVKIDNDVRVGMLGEWKRGAARPYQDVIGVFVGTGVGGGLVLENRMRRGRGSAGEIGHTIVKEGGRTCSCGRPGHLESYAGRARIEAHARDLVNKGKKTDLFDIMAKRGRDRVTSGVIARAIDHGDKLTIKLIDEAVWALGIALSNAQNLLDVEAVLIGGGLGDRLGAPFVQRIADAMAPQLFAPDRAPAMLTTELGDLGGAVGAAVLAGG
ncbi:MAG: ROK family protein [Actinomycetota bacterium]